jgi:hypothetical protein
VKYSAQFLVAILKPVRKRRVNFCNLHHAAFRFV